MNIFIALFAWIIVLATFAVAYALMNANVGMMFFGSVIQAIASFSLGVAVKEGEAA